MRTAPALLVALAATLALAGCVPDDDPVVVDPGPSAAPIFESDEEALAAAEEAYGAYLAVSDSVLNEGGVDSERLLAVATEELYGKASEGFASFEANGWHGTGFTSFDSLELQSYFTDALPGEQTIAVYVCVDLSDVDVVDSNGISVVSDSRIDRSPYVVGFTTVNTGDPSLLVSSDEPWDGSNFCGE
jgi:hypothetical protein